MLQLFVFIQTPSDTPCFEYLPINVNSLAGKILFLEMKRSDAMHLSTIIRKTIFRLSGKIALSDAVRNFTYAWAWSFLRELPAAGRICDIGSRTSLFPAFLAWRGMRVSVVEKDSRFIDAQRRISNHWRVRPEIFCGDFLEFAGDKQFLTILSLFSLQHSRENDVPAYRKAAAMLESGGLLLSACECNSHTTQWHRERDDGPLRI